MSARRRNVDLALLAWARGEIGRPYQWGETDCASLARRASVVVVGRDPFAGAPRWSTRTGALRALRRTGGLEAAMLERGATRHPLAFARTGDVVLTPGREAEGLPRVAVVLGAQGLISTPQTGVAVSPLGGLAPESYVLRWPDE